MKKIAMLLTVVGVFAIGAFAQTPNFAGTWKLDTGKLDERRAATIESQTMAVEQTATEVKSTTTTVRKPGAAGGGGQGGPPGGGGGGFGGGQGAGGPVTYTLDGKEVVVDRDTPNGKISIKTTSKINGNKLEVTSSMVGPDGTERKSKTTWELSADGKTLTVKATRPGRDGVDMTTESLYSKS